MIGLRFNFRLFIYGCLYLGIVGWLAFAFVGGQLEQMGAQGLLQFIFAMLIPHYALIIGLCLAALAPGLLLVVMSVFPRIKLLPWT